MRLMLQRFQVFAGRLFSFTQVLAVQRLAQAQKSQMEHLANRA